MPKSPLTTTIIASPPGYEVVVLPGTTTKPATSEEEGLRQFS
jgi:hypothetical protein